MNERIKMLRSKVGLNQRDFALKVKFSHSMLAMFESGQRKPKEIHISQICQAFGVNERWLRTGEGEIFRKTNNTLFENVAKEYNLNETEKKIIATYLRLDEKKRVQLIDFVSCFTQEFLNNASDISATLAIRPIHNDEELTREEAHKMLDMEYNSKEKGLISSVPTPRNGLIG